MATRRQPTRRARKSRLESSDQTKKPKKHKINSELRPILSSSASSCTVARSSGLSMGNRHQWSEEEELALFAEAETLLKTQTFCKKSKLNATLAERLNALFPEAAVTFAAKTIKNKGGEEVITCNGTSITCSATVLGILFSETASASETTNSGAADSVTVNHGMKKKKCTIPECTIRECIELVESIEELSDQEKADASDLMRLEDNRKIFMNFKNQQVRLLWIKRHLASRVNNPSAEHGVEDQRTA